MTRVVRNLALLVLALVARQARAQDMPPQCDVQEILYPQSMVFMGPAQSIQAGTIDFSFHEFGPLNVAPAAADSPDGAPEPAPSSPSPAADPDPEAAPAPALVFIHGFGSTQYDWPLAMLEALALERRVVVFDNPRIGLSTDSSEEPLTVGYMANATLALIAALGLDRPDVLGYSMGADVALTLAAQYSDRVGAVVAVAGSLGGPAAPQPEGGLAGVLAQLQAIFASKYQVGPSGAAVAALASAAPLDAGAATDPYKLFFPLGALDPAACELVHSSVSLAYAVGLLPLDNNTGYAMPGGVYEGGIIPSLMAVVPAQAAMDQQRAALEAYHTLPSPVAAAIGATSTQILFVGGSQDNVIPITSQTAAAALVPGSWLVQVPNTGHGLPFLHPVTFAATVSDFLSGAQDISPAVRSYYNTTAPASGAAAPRAGAVALLALAAVMLLV